jgi:hypothetical protein
MLSEVPTLWASGAPRTQGGGVGDSRGRQSGGGESHPAALSWDEVAAKYRQHQLLLVKGLVPPSDRRFGYVELGELYAQQPVARAQIDSSFRSFRGGGGGGGPMTASTALVDYRRRYGHSYEGQAMPSGGEESDSDRDDGIEEWYVSFILQGAATGGRVRWKDGDDDDDDGSAAPPPSEDQKEQTVGSSVAADEAEEHGHADATDGGDDAAGYEAIEHLVQAEPPLTRRRKGQQEKQQQEQEEEDEERANGGGGGGGGVVHSDCVWFFLGGHNSSANTATDDGDDAKGGGGHGSRNTCRNSDSGHESGEGAGHGAMRGMGTGMGMGMGGVPGHIDQVDQGGTWHIQHSGSKLWVVQPYTQGRHSTLWPTHTSVGSSSSTSSHDDDNGRPGSSSFSSSSVSVSGGVLSLRVLVEAGDLFMINTRLWWHHTEIPTVQPQPTPPQPPPTPTPTRPPTVSLSYAREFSWLCRHVSVRQLPSVRLQLPLSLEKEVIFLLTVTPVLSMDSWKIVRSLSELRQLQTALQQQEHQHQQRQRASSPPPELPLLPDEIWTTPVEVDDDSGGSVVVEGVVEGWLNGLVAHRLVAAGPYACYGARSQPVLEFLLEDGTYRTWINNHNHHNHSSSSSASAVSSSAVAVAAAATARGYEYEYAASNSTATATATASSRHDGNDSGGTGGNSGGKTASLAIIVLASAAAGACGWWWRSGGGGGSLWTLLLNSKKRMMRRRRPTQLLLLSVAAAAAAIALQTLKARRAQRGGGGGGGLRR